jgi:pyruvate,water dikinase
MSPADTPDLLGISGVVLERGGLLSQAAIMAREFGIPMLTGVAEVTEILRTGMLAVVDGDSGVIEFVEELRWI